VAKEFVVSVVEVETNIGRCLTIKTESVGRLVGAFQAVAVELGTQLGMKQLRAEDVKGTAAGSETKR
jgi:hypothetical protein